MPVRIVVTKQNGSGEQIQADVCQWNPVTGEIVHKDVGEMAELADTVLKFADVRLEELNVRMLEARGLRQYFTPEEWQKVQSVMEVVQGMQSADMLRQRWDALKEEQEELEAMRQAHYESQQMNKALSSEGECTCARFTADVKCPVHEVVA